jgi:uncharacterized protein (UPF0548 family)
MFLFRKPSMRTIHAFLQSQARLEFTYPAAGATATEPPPGYVADYTRIKLGEGSAIFTSAKVALQSWEQFHLGWVEPCWPNTPLEPG